MKLFDPKTQRSLCYINYQYMDPLDEINLCRMIIKRHPKLIKDYPSLEEALKLLDGLISREQD